MFIFEQGFPHILYVQKVVYYINIKHDSIKIRSGATEGRYLGN